MNRIVLVGNGFDLAHDLPTKYEDFFNWYLEERINSLKKEGTRISKDALCAFQLRNTTSYRSWNNFFLTAGDWLPECKPEELISYFVKNSDIFIVEFTPLFNRIFQSFQTKGWVDIENEYYILLRSFLSRPEYVTPAELNNELDYIRLKLGEYLRDVENKYITEDILNKDICELILEPFYQEDISIFALDDYNNLPKDTLSNSDIKFGKRIYIKHMLPSPKYIMAIDFNYTKTANMYMVDNPRYIVNHIHGYLNNLDSVIFGYGDELDINYNDLLRLNDNEYLRNIKSIKYLETDNYRKIISFIESDKYQIYIMGHSCGNSDRTLMNALFEHRNCVSIKPFYYKSQDGNDNYQDIIQNISRNFTDMQLMRVRVVNKKYCEPLPQNEVGSVSQIKG